MSALSRFRAWWQGREPRERVMLALMAAMLAAFTWWYGLLWPLRALREDAGERYDRAALALQAAEAEIASLAAAGDTMRPPAAGEALQTRLLASLREAGISPSRQRTAADGAFVIEFDRVASPELFGWLGQLAEREALAPSTLRVERADGQLRAEVGFGGGAP